MIRKISSSEDAIDEDIRRIVINPKKLDLIRKEFGSDFLKESTLGNWRLRAKIPKPARDGFILGSVVQREALIPGLEEIPAPLIKYRLGDVMATGLWADSAWHILNIKNTKDKLAGGEILHFWDRANLLPEHLLRPGKPVPSQLWLPHTARGETHAEFDNRQVIYSGAFQDDQIKNRILYKKEFSRGTEAPVSFGYRFTARNTFRKKRDESLPREENLAFEFFGSQAMIPVWQEHVLVSIPDEYIEFDAFQQYVTAKTFAPITPTAPVEYVKQVLTKGFAPDVHLDPSLFATWWEVERVERLVRDSDLRLPDLLKEHCPALFESGKSVFHADREVANPLTYQMIFWNLPRS
jgi:hypothetical protein